MLPLETDLFGCTTELLGRKLELSLLNQVAHHDSMVGSPNPGVHASKSHAWWHRGWPRWNRRIFCRIRWPRRHLVAHVHQRWPANLDEKSVGADTRRLTTLDGSNPGSIDRPQFALGNRWQTCSIYAAMPGSPELWTVT